MSAWGEDLCKHCLLHKVVAILLVAKAGSGRATLGGEPKVADVGDHQLPVVVLAVGGQLQDYLAGFAGLGRVRRSNKSLKQDLNAGLADGGRSVFERGCHLVKVGCSNGGVLDKVSKQCEGLQADIGRFILHMWKSCCVAFSKQYT